MLTSTFVMLKGVGAFTERKWWDDGVKDWDAFLTRPMIPGISAGRKVSYDGEVATAQRQFEAGNTRYFGRCLKSREHWRLFTSCRSRILYLDIETTGVSPSDGEVTVVGLYRDSQFSSLVHGESLTEERLAAELAQSDLLVTFFGSVFDVPYLRAKFPRMDFALPHFDLCFAARRLGLHGGLKHIEVAAGIERPPDLRGLDGWDAVHLWHRWRAGNATALDQLMRYNAADTCNLEPLAVSLHDQLVVRYGPPSPSTVATTHP